MLFIKVVYHQGSVKVTLEKGNHLPSTLACRAILHNNLRKWTGHFWCLRTGWESKSLLRVLSQNSLVWHIWFVLSISVYWEESSRGWGGIALFEIFWVNCLWWEQWSWENSNQETEQPSTWATNVEISVGFLHLLYYPAVSKGKVHVNAAVEVGFTSWNSLKKAQIQIRPLSSLNIPVCAKSSCLNHSQLHNYSTFARACLVIWCSCGEQKMDAGYSYGAGVKGVLGIYCTCGLAQSFSNCHAQGSHL